jgi:hypothetical protein
MDENRVTQEFVQTMLFLLLPVRSGLFSVMMLAMLQTVGISAIALTLIFGSLAASANGPNEQQPSAAPANPAAGSQDLPSMPSDPEAILEAAGKLNGLHGPGLKPWHAKLTYQIFKEGKLETEGTFEESWISDTNYKQTYTSPDFTQTDYGTDNGLFRTGAQGWPGFHEMQIQRRLVLPISSPVTLPNVESKMKQIGSGVSRVPCVVFSSKNQKLFLFKDSYCFDPDHPILRLEASSDGLTQVLYNEIVRFQGRLIARDVRSTYKNEPLVTVHVDEIGALAETAFTVPPDAMRI